MLRSVFRNTATLTRLTTHQPHYHSILSQNSPKSIFLFTRAFSSTHSNASVTITKDPPFFIPEDLLKIHHPKPVRHEITESKVPLDTKALENINIKPDLHRNPATFGDKVAFNIVKLLRVPTDWFFKRRYIHRAVMLETVAAVPGMVAATIRHLRSLRKLKHDGGWIDHLLHEAENERMHLMTWMRISKPVWWERGLITLVQGGFYNAFFLLYLVSPKTAHRVVGYLEEEAIVSYNSFLKEIDEGRIENSKNVPDLAIDYWNLNKDTATLRDLVLAIRADEATHRDTNHHFADRILLGHEDLREDIEHIFKETNLSQAKKMAGLTDEATKKWKRTENVEKDKKIIFF